MGVLFQANVRDQPRVPKTADEKTAEYTIDRRNSKGRRKNSDRSDIFFLEFRDAAAMTGSNAGARSAPFRGIRFVADARVVEIRCAYSLLFSFSERQSAASREKTYNICVIIATRAFGSDSLPL